MAEAGPAGCGRACANDELVYFGTHTQASSGAMSEDKSTVAYGIFAAWLDPHSGRLTPVGPVAQVDRPTWVVEDPVRSILYSTSEMGNDGRLEDAVFAFSLDPVTGRLQQLGKTGSGGSGATHLALDLPSHTLFVANYGSGQVSALPILPDGRLAAAVSSAADYGSGPSPRQKSPHAHAVTVDPSRHFVLIADLGADRIFVHRFDPVSRQLTQADTPYVALPPGTGPRHLVFHPGGRFVFLVTELSAELISYSWDREHGHLEPLQALAVFPPGYQGQKSGGEIRVSAGGRFVYVSTRGDDNAIVVYSVEPGTGRLSQLQRISSQGRAPWSFSLDASGRWLLVANEASGSVTELEVDRTTGRLRATAETLSIPRPVSVTLVCPQGESCLRR